VEEYETDFFFDHPLGTLMKSTGEQQREKDDEPRLP
jgi:hypothetical protein